MAYIVERSEKDGHEHKLHVYGVYDEYDDAHDRMEEKAEELVDQLTNNTFSARIDRMDEDTAVIMHGMGEHVYIGIREMESNEPIEETITVWT